MPSVTWHVFNCGDIEINYSEDPSPLAIRRWLRSCDHCRAERDAARLLELEEQSRQRERAKCLLEYFQGARVVPYTDAECAGQRQAINRDYLSNKRLHPYCQYANADMMKGVRNAISVKSERIAELRTEFGIPVSQNELSLEDDFAQMLRRSDEIRRTGRFLTAEDYYYHLRSIGDRSRCITNALYQSFYQGSKLQIPEVKADVGEYSRNFLPFGQWSRSESRQPESTELHGEDLVKDLLDYAEYLRNQIPDGTWEINQINCAKSAVTTAGYLACQYSPSSINIKEDGLDTVSCPLNFRDWGIKYGGFQNKSFEITLVTLANCFVRYFEYLKTDIAWAHDVDAFKRERNTLIDCIRQMLDGAPSRVSFREKYESSEKDFRNLIDHIEVGSVVNVQGQFEKLVFHHCLAYPPPSPFHDVYSLNDPSLLSLIPRPVYALLVTIPLTAAWKKVRQTENDSMEEYSKSGLGEPVIWFKQTIRHACGLIGLLHSVCNGEAADMIMRESELARLIKEAIPLKMAARAKLLEDSDVLERAHAVAALAGDTDAPRLHASEHLGNHFIAFVKGSDGHLWELEGSRKGPLDRGIVGGGDDMLSERALEMGIKR